ncbi:MAG TPA: hypothetical protein G4O00_10995 [Thermoflexia bacterium]|jgi:predicted regulator of Ras-like GTPase activity (Roadblock/LC7/MglB family)|nr:hypothetical protein [Thermoflexia bacterium]
MSTKNHRTTGSTPSPSLQRILEQARNKGGFQVSVLTSTEGLPIITTPSTYNSDLASAMVALLQKVSNEAQRQLGMSEVDEVTIRGRDHTRLVCRRIIVAEDELILVAIVPPGHAYRRVMNWAVREIRRALS